jgi:hypothetical protein
MGFFKKQKQAKRANTFVSRKCKACDKPTRFPKYTKRGIRVGAERFLSKNLEGYEMKPQERQRINGHSVLVCSKACDFQLRQKIAVDTFTLPEDANKEAKKILAVVREAARRKKDTAILSLSDDQILYRIKQKRIWGEKIEAPSRNTFGRRKSNR